MKNNEQLFENEKEFQEWLSQVLHTGEDLALYEGNQIRVERTAIPVYALQNRKRLQRMIYELFLPVLPFVTHLSFCTYEPSSAAAQDYQRYQANDLQDDFLLAKAPAVLTFIDCSEPLVTMHVLTIQEHPGKRLELEQLIKHLVMTYLIHQPEPFEYLVTANHMVLRNPVSGETVDVTCRDTNVYLRLFAEWQTMRMQHIRRLQNQRGYVI